MFIFRLKSFKYQNVNNENNNNNAALPTIVSKRETGPIKVMLDLKKEYEEDQELIAMLDPSTYKKDKPKANNNLNPCEIIPEEDEDLLLQKNINSINNPNNFNRKSFRNNNNVISTINNGNIHNEPVYKRMIAKRMHNNNTNNNTHNINYTNQNNINNEFPLLNNIQSPKHVQPFMLQSMKLKHNNNNNNNTHNHKQQSKPLAVISLVTTPRIYEKNYIESPSTSEFTHDTPDNAGNDIEKEQIVLLSKHFHTKPTTPASNCFLPLSVSGKPYLNNINNYNNNEDTNQACLYKAKPLSQQKCRYNSNFDNLPKPRRGFSSTGHYVDGSLSNTYNNKSTSISTYRKMHKIKIERGMVGIKLIDKLINQMKFDLST